MQNHWSAYSNYCFPTFSLSSTSSLLKVPHVSVNRPPGLNRVRSRSLFEMGILNQDYMRHTVEPVYNGPLLSGHPLLSGQLLRSRLSAHTNAVFVTCIRRPPLLSGRGHPVAVLCLSFFVIFTCIKRPPLNGN